MSEPWLSAAEAAAKIEALSKSERWRLGITTGNWSGDPAWLVPREMLSACVEVLGVRGARWAIARVRV